ncbi:MAG: sialate O-acetylesterase [Bacteroidetes bacterium]|nr:sialate O-acetylesterase [Bacteroidota bacterium]
MIKTVIFFVLLLADFSVSAQVDANFHVYLLAGQSNMAGRGPLDSAAQETDPRILMLDQNNQWVTAKDPVHFDKPKIAGVGPAIAFAKAMLAKHPGIKIGLIPCALGGSPIRVWEPDSVYLDSFHPYDDAVARAKIAMQKGVLKGMLWHQGESDNNPSAAAVYTDKFKQLVERFRRDLHMPRLPVVAGETGYFNKGNIINAVIDALPAHVPYTAVVSAEGLTDKGDNIHFDTPSARELGRRYAAAMQKLAP